MSELNEVTLESTVPTDSCWGENVGSETNKYELERREFTDKLACQEWCDADTACLAVVVTAQNCVKLATESVYHPKPGSQSALKDCWTQKKVTAKTKVVRDDSAATAECPESFTAVDCESDYPMSTVLDGVTIEETSCTVAMSILSTQYVNVTVTCRQKRKCSTKDGTQLSNYEIFTHPTWVTGNNIYKCPTGYNLTGCYITSSWYPRINNTESGYGGRLTTNTDTCSFNTPEKYKLSAVCRILPSYWDENCIPEDCPAGKYRSNYMKVCKPCIENSISQPGATSCILCGDGQVANVKQTNCDKCQAGTYRNSSMKTCTKCDTNSVSKTGAAVCSVCEPGTVANENKTKCEACPEGEYRDSTMSTCQQCQGGSLPMWDKSSCRCPLGWTLESKTQPSCTLCSGSEACHDDLQNHLEDIFKRAQSGNVKDVTEGLQQIIHSKMNISSKDARKLIKVLSSSRKLISNRRNGQDTKALKIAIVETVEGMKDSEIRDIPNDEKTEILETVEDVSRSVRQGESLKTLFIAAQSVRTQNKEIELLAPESVPLVDLPIKLNFRNPNGGSSNIAMMDETFKDILPKIVGSNATIHSPIVSINFMSPEGKVMDNVSFSLVFQQKEHPEYRTGYNIERKCVYLNTTTNTWLSNGCKTLLNTDKTCTCTCSHTTSFAVLLSPTPVTDHEGQESIGYTMFVINVLFLSLAFCLITPFKKLRRKQVVMMQLSLVMTLMLGNITFVVLSATSSIAVDDNGAPLLSLNAGCITGVIISQYFFLSAFFWMGCIAWTFFNKIVRAVKTFGKTDKHYFRNCALLSWICPIIFPVTSFLFSLIPNKSSEYTMPYVGGNRENGSHCWVEDPWRYIGFLVPAYLILLFNCVCFGMVAKVILNSTGKPGGSEAVSVKTAKAMMVVAVSVGLPWIVAGLAVGPAASFMQYLFIIFIGLQGPLLFVALVVLQEDAKEHTQQLLLRLFWKDNSLLARRQKETSPKMSKDGTLQTQILKNDSSKEPTTSESDDGTRTGTTSKVTTL
ncbi:hypothetical protein ACHWQZ_G000767 [Mnemiopsis leidyi]